MEYYGLLKQSNPDQPVEVVLCANIIPHERRIFLENVGIECKELGLTLVQKVAQKYNYIFLDQPKIEEVRTPVTEGRRLEATRKLTSENSQDTKVWIFQANPQKYDILNALSDPSLDKNRWLVNQHKAEIKKSDIALTWMSGNGAGIYAVAEILSKPTEIPDTPESNKYWIEEPLNNERRLRVHIKIIKKLLNNPVLRQELKIIPELKNLSILRFQQGTNFPVADGEWQIIKQIIEKL